MKVVQERIHVRIACPEIKYPDFYGVDMPTKEELLATIKALMKCVIILKLKSLKF